MNCFDALRSTLNAYFGGELASAEMARDALNKGLDLAKQLVEITEKLNEIPDEAKSEAAKEFTAPAKELHEYDEHRKLVFELANLKSLEALQTWYAESRQRIDRVVSQKLRNELFDAIRDRRKELEQN
jgi:dsDNA-binding SOS-regulon protein